MSMILDGPGTEVPFHRACANCRSQKVRCITDELNPDICQRCVRSGRQCVFTPVQKRKQRKRTDTRVAELEREMQMMQNMLKDKKRNAHAQANPLSSSIAAGRSSNLRDNGTVQNEPGVGNGFPASHASALLSQESNTQTRPRKLAEQTFVSNGKDVVDRDIISMATARQLFETYRSELFPHYPMVPVPTSMTADDMRHSKPILFLATLAAAAIKENPDLSALLDKEILHAYAERSLVNSQKSLEMVQALLVSAVWYHPPDRFGHLKYYEYIHMAATIAMDIGIGTRPVPHRSRPGPIMTTRGWTNGKHLPAVHPLEDATNPDLSMAPRSRDSSPSVGSIDSRRTFVSVYSVCTSVSMSLRRPNMLRISSYVRECVDYLEHSPDALPSDRILVAWVRLLMIAEEITNAFSYDDPGGIACITDLRTQLMLRDFTKRLEAWLANLPKDNRNSSLMIIYWTTRLYLNELALHIDHSPEDFKAPYQMGVIHQWDGEDVPTELLAQTVAECVASSHHLISTFLELDVDDLRSLPVLSYVRVSYAAFVLAKLCLSANHPGSQLARVLDQSSLKAQSILDRAILRIQAVLSPSNCRVPSIFLALLFKLRQWCLHPELIEPPQTSFIDIGMQNPVQMTKDAASEESRVTEQSTPDNSSAQTLSEAQPGMESSDGDFSHMYHNSGQMVQQDMPRAPLAGTTSQSSSTDPSMTSVNDNDPTLSTFWTTCEQMQLDPNLFQLFADTNEIANTQPIDFGDWPSFFGLLENVTVPDTMPMDESEQL